MKSMVISLPSTQPIITDMPREPLSKRIASFFRTYGLALLMIIMLLSGLCFGALRSTSDGGFYLTGAERFLITLPSAQEGKTPVMIFADSFSVSFIFTAALLFLAVTPSGLPGIPALMFFRGVELGVMAGVFCRSCGFTGLAYFVSVVLSGAFLSSLALVYFSQYCIGFSASMLLAAIGSRMPDALKGRLRELLMNGAYALLLIAFASVTDTLLYFLIGRMFEISV